MMSHLVTGVFADKTDSPFQALLGLDASPYGNEKARIRPLVSESLQA
jgi:hypothetical protein